MKKTIAYLTWAALAIFASCSREMPEIQDPSTLSEGLTLTVFCDAPETRAEAATSDGVGNENLIKWVDYFIYTEKADENTEAVLSGRYEVPDNGSTEPFTFTVTPLKLSDVFPAGSTQCKVFMVANYTGEFSDYTSTTITAIKALEVTEYKSAEVAENKPTFLHNTYTDRMGVDHVTAWPTVAPDEDLCFIMTSDEAVELDLIQTAGDLAAQGTIQLKRLAVKVTVELNLKDLVNPTDGGIYYWTPDIDINDKAHVYMSRAMKSANLGGTFDATDFASLESLAGSNAVDIPKDLVEYSDGIYICNLPETTPKEGFHTYTTTFYTYPLAWNNGDDEPHIKLVLPWYAKKSADAEAEIARQQEFYYKIVFPEAKLEHNMEYHFSVDVEVPSGLDQNYIDLVPSYKVAPWVALGDMGSNVSSGKYLNLSIPKPEYTMYESLLEVAITTSGEVEIAKLEMYKDNYSQTTTKQDYFVNGDPNAASTSWTYAWTDKDNKSTTANRKNTVDAAGKTAGEWVSVQLANQKYKLVVDHTMNNDLSDDNFDAAPYHYVITLHLKDLPRSDDRFDKTLTITQYPAIYVTPDPSNTFAYVKGVTGQSNAVSGYIWDDYVTSTNASPSANNSGDHFLGTVTKRTFDNLNTNQNKNQYIVTVSILDRENSTFTMGNQSKPMVIGDPRGEPTKLDDMADLGDNYRPAADDKQDVIAPQFRIASSYGASYRFSYEGAKKRCAAYQENGRPAGRWRLPTLAEIQFLINLSNAGKIPELFSPSQATLTNNNTTSDGRTYNRGTYYLGYWAGGGWNYFGTGTIDLSSYTVGYINRYYIHNGNNYYQQDYGYTVTTSSWYFGATRCVYDEWYWGDSDVDEAHDEWLGYKTSKSE